MEIIIAIISLCVFAFYAYLTKYLCEEQDYEWAVLTALCAFVCFARFLIAIQDICQ
jgi:drug/metabolite transporter (DMT)-like permease